jgi:hypothetical protein
VQAVYCNSGHPLLVTITTTIRCRQRVTSKNHVNLEVNDFAKMTEAKLDYEIPARESLLNVVLDKLQKAGKVWLFACRGASPRLALQRLTQSPHYYHC